MHSMRLLLLTVALVLTSCTMGASDDPESSDGSERVGSVAQALTTLSWSGYTWNIKSGSGMGPGPNSWSDSTGSVWVDGTDSLNLKVRKIGGVWHCAEVWLPDALGHGTYEFFIKSRTDIIHKNLVNGFFLYQDDTHELDVEWSRWGVGNNPNNGVFGIQPSTFQYWHQDIVPGSWQKDRIIWTTDGSTDQVEYQVETDSVVVQSWTQTIPAGVIPDPAQALVHINNWMFQGKPPGSATTLTLASFTFTPQ